MRLRATSAALLALTLAAAAPAPAPSGPPATPTRDALLAYRIMPAAGEAITVSVAIRAGGRGLRVDLPDQTYVLAEPAIHTVLMVVPLEHTVLDMPWTDGPQALFLVDGEQQFTRKGEASVAGLRCTVWETAGKEATTKPGSICVTNGGLILRNESEDAQGRRNLVEAVLVRFQSLPPALVP